MGRHRGDVHRSDDERFCSGLAAIVGCSARQGGQYARIERPSAPVVEEAAKGSALLILFFMVRREVSTNTLDGIVYGSLVGIGFAMTEKRPLLSGASYLEDGLVGVGACLFLPCEWC